VAFTVRGRSSDALARQLAAEGLGVGAGDFYAYRLVEALGLDNADGVVRASFVHYTAPAEVDRLIGALDAMLP
jgi:selenocysteine lyase/cysteine desulfurase